MAGNQLKFDAVAVDRVSNTFDKIADSMDEVLKRLEKLDGKAANVKVDVDANTRDLDKVERSVKELKDGKGLDGLAKKLGGVGSSLAGIGSKVGALGLVGVSAAAAATKVAQLGAALAPAVGIVAALPAMLAVRGAAFATFATALSGVQEGFAAAFGDDAAEFEKSIEKLAPAAQDTARALHDLAPAFMELRNAVQDQFFQGFDDALKSIADTLMGPVQNGMVSVATQTNGLALSLAGVATEADSVQFVEETFGTLAGVIAQVQEPLTELARALVDVGRQGMDSILGLSGGFAEGLSGFAGWLQAAADAGKITEWVDGAVVVFKQLGAILAPIGGILATIGSAASTAGGDILGVFGSLLQSVEDFLKSTEGADFLSGLFEGLSSIGSALQPIIVALGTALSGILPVIGEIGAALGPGLEAIITSLGEGLAALAPSLVPVAEAIAGIAAAAAPVLPILGEILAAVADALAPILTAAAEGIGQVFEAMKPTLDALLPLVSEFAAILSETLAPMFVTLGEILAAFLPQLGELALMLIEQMLPVWEEMSGKIGELMPVLGELIVALAEALLPIISELLPVWMELQATIGGLFLDALIAILPLIVTLLEVLTPVIEIVSALASVLLNNLVTAIDVVGGFISGAIGLLAAWWEAGEEGRQKLLGAFQGIVNGIREAFGKVKERIDSAVGWFKSLPSRIKSAVGNLGRLLWNAGKDIIQGLINGVTSMISGLQDTFSGVTSMIPDWKGPMSVDLKLLAPSGAALMSGLMDGIASQIPSLQAQLGDVTSLVGSTSMDASLAASAAGMAASAPGSSTVRVLFDFSGMDSEMAKAIRKMVRVEGGGNVQVAFGRR